MLYRRTLSLDSALVRQYVEMTHALWGGGQSVESRITTFNRRLHSSDQELTRLSGLVSPSGQLLAGLKQYYLRIRVGDVSHRCVGLGGIFTEPKARRQGHAEALVRTVLAEAAAEGFAFALLFSDIGPEYYARFGFRPLSASNWSSPVSALPHVAPLDVRVALPNELELLVSGFADGVSAALCSVERTVATWRFFHEFNGVEQDVFLSDGNEPLGQMSITRCKARGYLWLEEWFLTPKAQNTEGVVERVWATLRALAEKDDVPLVRGWVLSRQPLPPESTLQVRAKQIPMLAALTSERALDSETLTRTFVGAVDHF